MSILSNSMLDLLPLGVPNKLLESSNNWNVNKLLWAVVLHRKYGQYKWSTACQLAQGVKLSCDDVNIICLALFDHLRSISALKKCHLFLCLSTSLIFQPYLCHIHIHLQAPARVFNCYLYVNISVWKHEVWVWMLNIHCDFLTDLLCFY